MEVAKAKVQFDRVVLGASCVGALLTSGAGRIINNISLLAPAWGNNLMHTQLPQILDKAQNITLSIFKPEVANAIVESAPDAAFVTASMAVLNQMIPAFGVTPNMTRWRYEVLNATPMLMTLGWELFEFANKAPASDCLLDAGAGLAAYLTYRLASQAFIRNFNPVPAGNSN